MNATLSRSRAARPVARLLLLCNSCESVLYCLSARELESAARAQPASIAPSVQPLQRAASVRDIHAVPQCHVPHQWSHGEGQRSHTTRDEGRVGQRCPSRRVGQGVPHADDAGVTRGRERRDNASPPRSPIRSLFPHCLSLPAQQTDTNSPPRLQTRAAATADSLPSAR